MAVETKYEEIERLLTIVMKLQLLTLKEIKRMALDFSALTAAVDNMVSEIQVAIAALNDPTVDTQEQSVINDLTNRLSSAASLLQNAVTPAPAASDPAATDASASAPADASASAPDAPAADEAASATDAPAE